MSTEPFAYDLIELTAPRLGLVALQTDETIEGDLRRLLPREAEFMVSRVPSSEEVTAESLAEMELHLTTAASLFPAGVGFAAVGYGCTSGTAQIGAAQVARRIRDATAATAVTQPLDSLIAACRHLGIRRLAMLSPYVAQVSDRLRHVLTENGLEIPLFGSFEVAEEAQVVRISPASIEAAAKALMQKVPVDALFVSCTNLRVLELIAPLEEALAKPVLSSNQVLAWHMMQLADLRAPADAPGRLFG